jgi:hypothetical protein
MSHYFEHSGVTFIYSSDLSGNVVIQNEGDGVELPGVALLAFVAAHIRREKIADLENAADFDILGIGK